MELLRYNNINAGNNRQGIWSIHSVAMFMMAVYIVLSSAFEFMAGYGFLSSVSLYAFLGFGVLNIIYKKQVVTLSNYHFVAVVLYFVMLTFSRFYTPEETKALVNMYYYRYFTLVVICFVTVNLIDSEDAVDYLMNCFVISGLVMVVTFVSTYGEQIFTLADQVAEAERLGQDFGNVNVVAQRLTFSLIFTLYMLMFKAKRFKWFYLLVLVSCMIIVLLTGSRKALLVITALALYIFIEFAKGKSLSFKIMSFVVMVILVGVVAYMIMTVPLFASIRQRIELTVSTWFGSKSMSEAGADLNRMRYITQGLKHWMKHPLRGNGMEYSFCLFGTYSHNNYVEILLNTGLIGFCIYYYPFVRTLWCAFNKKINIPKSFRILTICIILTILINDVAIVSYYDRHICMLMAAVASGTLIMINGDKDKQS